MRTTFFSVAAVIGSAIAGDYGMATQIGDGQVQAPAPSSAGGAGGHPAGGYPAGGAGMGPSGMTTAVAPAYTPAAPPAYSPSAALPASSPAAPPAYSPSAAPPAPGTVAPAPSGGAGGPATQIGDGQVQAPTPVPTYSAAAPPAQSPPPAVSAPAMGPPAGSAPPAVGAGSGAATQIGDGQVQAPAPSATYTVQAPPYSMPSNGTGAAPTGVAPAGGSMPGSNGGAASPSYSATPQTNSASRGLFQAGLLAVSVLGGLSLMI